MSPEVAAKWRDVGVDFDWLRRRDAEEIAILPDVEDVARLRADGLNVDLAIRAAQTIERTPVDRQWLIDLLLRLEAIPSWSDRRPTQIGLLRDCEAGVSREAIEFYSQLDHPERHPFLGKALPIEWFESGISAHVAAEATRSGWSVEETQQQIDLARAPASRPSVPDWLRTEVTPEVDAEETASELNASGLPEDWIGFGTRDVLDASMTLSLESTALPLNVVKWYFNAGITEPAEILAWFKVGIAGAAAQELRRCGLDPDDGLAWLRAGFLPKEIRTALDSSKTIESAVSPRAGCHWRDALTRSKGSGAERKFAIRNTALGEAVWGVLSTLAVPQRYSGMMFASSHTSERFLDGGRESTDGYGFGSVSGNWIVGFHAFRFVCSRLGLPQPRRLKGEEAVPTPQLLDDAFQEQLAKDWSAYLEWGKQRPTDVSPMDIDDLSATGIEPDEWRDWERLGFSTYQARVLRKFGLAWAEQLLALNLAPDEIQRLVQDSQRQANYDEESSDALIEKTIAALKEDALGERP